MEHQVKQLWQEALSVLETEMSKVSYDTWAKSLIPISIEGNVFTFETYDIYYKNTIIQRYGRLIQNTLRDLTKVDYTLKINLQNDADVRHTSEQKESPDDNLAKQDPLKNQSNLNPRYVFDTFVVGNSNRMAHAASLAVSEAPGKAYNPLFLYGGVGLGKTHLMHSIAHFILSQDPNTKIMYASSEKFTNELINAIKDDKNENFRKKYRNIDVLLIDDIQFISGKEGTQEEFFHTFNTLYEANKQIIISSDRPPKEIKTLEDRLRSRFEWGLIADIQSPDFETRIAILRKKADSENIIVPNDVMNFIAASIVSNIRELEGALTRIIAYTTLTNKEITLELAEDALKDLFSENEKRLITIDLIQDVVAGFYGIKAEEIRSKKRNSSIVFPRQIAMYLSRKLLELSLPKIGEKFGGRDHSTVIHSCDKIEDILETDSALQKTILDLEKKILGK